MAPEYVRRGEFSAKSDVFSFGVLVLEIVSGRKVKNFHDEKQVESLPSYVSIWLQICPFSILTNDSDKLNFISNILLCTLE